MSRSRQRPAKVRTKVLAPALAGAALMLGLVVVPVAADAFSSGFDSRPVSLAARGGIGSFTPASVDRRLAAKISVNALSHGQLFRFTPAGSSTRPDRSVTVAVRVDPESARAISFRTVFAAAASAPGTMTDAATPERIAPTAFNLGVARGYNSFAQKLTTPTEVARLEIPDLAAFDAGRGERSSRAAPARFLPRIAVDESAKPGRAPRTLEGQGDYSVDVGGSYRVSGNVAVTAGVRYRSERDRIAPLTDSTQDSQAVYVGTQFRF
jgi:hypothetical protein